MVVREKRMLETECAGVIRSVRVFEAGESVVIVFQVDEDGKGVVAVKRDAVLEVLPFVVINLDSELLGTLVMLTLR